jgi:PAS domain S-box-containing protein
LFGISRDITERKRAEELVRYQAYLLENVSDAIISSDVDSIIQSWNMTCEEIYGWSAGEVIGKPVSEIVRPDWADGQREMVADRVSTDGYWEGDLIHRHKDGTPINISSSVTLLQDEEGNPTGVVSTNRDITERVRMEEALRESENQYRALVENIDEVIYRAGMDGNLTYVSPAIKSLLGYTASEVVGRSFAEFLHEEDLERARSRFEMIASGRRMEPAEYQVRTKSGEIRWISVSSQLISDDDQIGGVQGLLVDVTERRRAEELIGEKIASTERGRLARELHDAVTQTLFSASVLAQSAPRMLDKNPTVARQNIEQLALLIRGALAEMRALLLELRPSDFKAENLAQLFDLLAESTRARTRAKVTVIVDSSCATPDEVAITLYRITQESLNNIAKHALASEVIVNLVCNHRGAKLSIDDDGRGFDPLAIPAGHLGVSIMRERAQKIGAAIKIDSEIGRGTQVNVSWSASGDVPEHE